MYRAAEGTEYYVVDGHVHFWDGSPSNQKNAYGKGFIEWLYANHCNISPAEFVWPEDKFLRCVEATVVRDLFEKVTWIRPSSFTPIFVTSTSGASIPPSRTRFSKSSTRTASS